MKTKQKKFANLLRQNTDLPLDDFRIVPVTDDEIESELKLLDGFREEMRDKQDESLTFGDY